METRILIPGNISLTPRKLLINLPQKRRKCSDRRLSERTSLRLDKGEDSCTEEPTSSSGLFICNEKDETQSVGSPNGSTTDELEDKDEVKVSKLMISSTSNSEFDFDSSDETTDSDSDTFTKNKNKKEKTKQSESLIGSSHKNSKSKRRRLKTFKKISKRNVDIIKMKEQNNQMALCAKEIIEKGTKFGPNDGEIRIIFLEEKPQQLSNDDVRIIFGCFDRVTEDPLDEHKQIRLCNWIRFLHTNTLDLNNTNGNDDGNTCNSNSDSDDPQNNRKQLKTDNLANKRKGEKVNLVARFVNGKSQFETIQRVEAGSELFVYFDIESINHSPSPFSLSQQSPSPVHAFPSTNLSQFSHLNNFDLFYASKHFNNLYSSDVVKIKQEFTHPFISDDVGPLDLSKSIQPLSLEKYGKCLPSPPMTIKRESPLDSPISEKDFSSPELSPLIKSKKTISNDNLFSISNVLQLQPVNLFQPYSNNTHKTSSFRNTSNSNPYEHSIKISGGNSSHFMKINSSIATSNSIGGGRASPQDTSRSFIPTESSRAPTNIVQIRPILRTRGRERSLLPCEVCGKAFDRPSLLKRHMRTHTGEKPHICDVCSKGFSTSSSLNTHRRIHSGEKPHQCGICGKRFTASSNLYYHRMTHNKEKPHKCNLCGKSFPTPGDLKSHQYVHSGQWPYNCPVCHRGFSKQTNLRNHLLLHSGDKPHNCHICGKKFALACNLRAHLRTHEEEPISSCSTCKRSFLTSLNMLVNGNCRSCLLTSHTKPPGDPNRLSTPSTLRKMRQTSPPPPTNANPLIAVPIPSHLNLNNLHHPPATQTSAIPPSIFPNAFNNNVNRSISSSTNSVGVTNPFLEQLFEWNYRFAKETAGNLSIMQQKLLESQMLAAQLMIGSSNTPTFGLGISELLRMRPQDFNSAGVDLNLNKFMQP